MALDRFSPAVREWFASTFPEPTAAQAQGWPAISSGAHSLILAPTGSGKTLTAFLWGIDRLVTTEPPDRQHRTRLLYLSPLRALAFDVEKNLRAPLQGIKLAAERLGLPFTEPVVGVRTGDTAARDRQQLIRHPPDLLITTPESLYLMLTSSARDTLRNVEAVIIDEIHALAPTKRGAHLMLSLERLDALCERPPQRIGLSATQRPLEEIARFLGGYETPGRPRPVTIVDAGIRKPLEIEVIVPVEDMGDLGQVLEEPRSGPASAGPSRKSIWPSIYPRVLAEVLAHRSTIIFCNARRLAERLAARLNELAEAEGVDIGVAGELVKAHHGSLAREQRVVIEDQLKRGELRGLVATSSLELGIDMGAVDLVIQVESPGAVSRGLQRIGRAGHSVGEPSKGKVFPKHRGDLLEAAVVTQRMHEGLIEATRYLRNPLDVLAQQIVAMVAMEEWSVDDLSAVVRRSAGYAELTDDVFHAVLDLLAGRYPSDEFGELRPRIVWDRVANRLRARDGARRLAVTSGGTIPDRGLFGVFLPDGTRVGELDEEMVYESRPGETFVLGASTWRIEDITFERVVVSPAPGQPGKMPFWHGDRPGRPLELGRALGAFVRETRAKAPEDAVRDLVDRYGLDEWAAGNVVGYLDEQAEAAGVVPDDRTVVIERFRDEIGDWRVCLLSPFGTPVHAPWAMAIEQRLVERYGMAVETMWSDDGIVLRLPDAAEEIPVEEILIDPDDIDDIVMSALPGTALFSSRFRECAARALLLPRRRPDRRTPLWQQRQRAADLLAVAAKYPSFPILLEASRECLQDVFDVPALRSVLADLRARRVRLVSVDTQKASPFAQSLLFNWIAAYMYEGDAPLAERRAAALALDRELLRELLGAEELRELIDADVLADLELDLQRLTPERQARSADEVHDLLRRLGDLSAIEVGLRTTADANLEAWLSALVAERRAIVVRVGGEERLVAAEDASRYRDALGCSLPIGLPAAFTDPVERPLDQLVARYARTHGPFLAEAPSRRLGAPLERVHRALQSLETDGRLVRGEFRPGGVDREWCDVEVLRQLRRRSLATLRKEVEPVDQAAFARFLPAWQGIGSGRRGLDGLVEAVGLLQGAPIPASALDGDVLALRVQGYRPIDLDGLCTSGDVVWMGAGGLGRARRPSTAVLPRPDPSPGRRPRHAGCSRRPPARGPPGPPRWARRLLLERPARRLTRAPRRPSCWPPCGTWCGPGRSPTTRWLRCGRRWVVRPPGGQRPPRVTAEGPSGQAAARTAHSHRPAGRGRPVVARGPAPRRTGVDDGGDARPGLAAARASRRADARSRAGGRVRGWVRVGVRHAEGAGGARPSASRLLRRRPRRGPVRAARCRRSPPRHPASRAPTVRRWCWPPPTPHSRTGPLCPGRRPAAGRRGRPAHSSCSTTGSCGRGSTAGATISSRSRRAGPAMATGPTGGCSPSSRPSRTAGCARWRCGRWTERPRRTRRWRPCSVRWASSTAIGGSCCGAEQARCRTGAAG